MSEANKAVVQSYIEACNVHDLSRWDQVLAPDYIHHDPNLPGGGQNSRDEHRQVINLFMTAFPDCRMAIHDQLAEGDKVATRWTFSGTHRAEIMGIPPTGKQISFDSIRIDRVVDGKMVEGWVNFDALGTMQQLGVIPT